MFPYINKAGTMDDTLWADTLAFTIKTEVQYFFILMLIASFFRRNGLEKFSVRNFRACYFARAYSIGCSSINAAIDANWTSFVIVVFTGIGIDWIVSWLEIGGCWLCVGSAISWRKSFDHAFQNSYTLGVQGRFLMALLTDQNLDCKMMLHWHSYFSWSQRQADQMHSWDIDHDHRQALIYLQAYIRILYRIVAIENSWPLLMISSKGSYILISISITVYILLSNKN